MAASYYRHSGKVPVAGLLLTLVLALPAVVLLAAAYAYAIVYIPVRGYLTFILSGGFGLLMGAAIVYALHRGKVRNSLACLALGGGIALFGYYAHWVTWTYAAFQRGDVDVSLAALWLDPAGLWALIQRVNEVGSVSVRGFKPTGALLYAFWGVELLLITAPPVMLAFGAVQVPFCEACDVWCDERVGAHAINLREEAELKEVAEAKDFAAMASFGAAPPEAGYYVRVDLARCPRCDRTNTLTLHKVMATVDSDGKRSETATLVLDRLLLDPAEYARAHAMVPTP